MAVEITMVINRKTEQKIIMKTMDQKLTSNVSMAMEAFPWFLTGSALDINTNLKHWKYI